MREEWQHLHGEEKTGASLRDIQAAAFASYSSRVARVKEMKCEPTRCVWVGRRTSGEPTDQEENKQVFLNTKPRNQFWTWNDYLLYQFRGWSRQNFFPKKTMLSSRSRPDPISAGAPQEWDLERNGSEHTQPNTLNRKEVGSFVLSHIHNWSSVQKNNVRCI